MNSNEEIKNQEPDFDHHHHDHHCGGRRMWKFPFIIAVVLVIKSALVMVLWNALIPEVFHGPELTYLQAIMLTLLAKILTGFGGAGFKHRFGHHHHHRHGWHAGRWMKMSPEERAKMKEALRARCRK